MATSAVYETNAQFNLVASCVFYCQLTQTLVVFIDITMLFLSYSHTHTHTHSPQLGAAKECPPGPAVAGATGEEAPLPHSSLQFQALPHTGDQPQGGTPLRPGLLNLQSLYCCWSCMQRCPNGFILFKVDNPSPLFLSHPLPSPPLPSPPLPSPALPSPPPVQVPVNLLRASRVFTFEPPPGVKANLIRTFSTVPAARMCKVCSCTLYELSRTLGYRAPFMNLRCTFYEAS